LPWNAAQSLPTHLCVASMSRYYKLSSQENARVRETLNGKKKSRKPRQGQAVLTDLVAFKLIHLADLISRGALLVFGKQFGLSNAELRALIALGEEQPLTIGELSRRAHIDKAWVSRSVRNLLERRLVVRQDHPTDSRMGLISLSSEGKAMTKKLAPVAWARQERLLGGLVKADVLRTVDQLIKNADEMLRKPYSASAPMDQTGVVERRRISGSA
jgi:DNA-binding MarR family transcriptional regulator